MKSSSWSELVRQVEDQGVVVDEQVTQRIQEENSIKYIFLKVVALSGSLLAMGFFFGFLFLAIGDSLGYLSFSFFGVLLYALSFLGNKKTEPALRDGVFVATYISAFACLIAACIDLDWSEKGNLLGVVVLSAIGFVVFKSKIIQFLSLISLYYGLVFLLGTLHLGYVGMALFWVVFIGVYLLFTKEVQLRTGSAFGNQKYNALLHAGVAVIFIDIMLDNLAFIEPSSWLNHNRYATYNELGHQIYYVFVRIILLGLTYFTLKQGLEKLSSKQRNIVIILSAAVILLLSSVMNGFGVPLTISLFFLVWSFHYRFQKGIIMAILMLLISVICYYYYLQVSLLVKSLILMGCGVVFLGGFLIYNRWNREK
ncbi:DUF4401 domain-containing protein [Myroides sp. WP-1]|uniref:DUF4401 domain-containing protein n=1 Tax=Myroides sp. WP-1 TaxID=2759944 RepID=UPI0015F96D59|nr:DUF4401 domain-containing protein [Myroides sp. WP-1]MBB1138047.1 DUF4401 domain-containing protein [Myroides sp. WP-1]